MIQSGLQVIYTIDEVVFIQNLVYYVERAYRTPDFGVWQRGSKYNDGTPEIHARFVFSPFRYSSFKFLVLNGIQSKYNRFTGFQFI